MSLKRVVLSVEQQHCAPEFAVLLVETTTAV